MGSGWFKLQWTKMTIDDEDDAMGYDDENEDIVNIYVHDLEFLPLYFNKRG